MEKQLNNSFTTGLEAGAELNENFSFREGMNATIPKLREVGLKNPIPLKVLSPYEARFNPSTHSGPYRFNEKQLEGFYSGFGFKCVELRDTLFYTNLQPHLRGYLGIYKKEL
mgnify:CR=1 FL=1